MPLIIILYNIVPQKQRWIVLLIASYIFFWSISGKLIIYLLITTLLMYFFGIWLDKIQRKRDNELKNAEKENKKTIRQMAIKKQRKILALASLIMIGTLAIVKYMPFITENIKSLFEALNLPIEIKIIKFMVPIGISFYTLQALSYILDVYKEKIKADRNIGRLALFISFFPQIMEGPFCRYSETAEDLWKCERTTYKNLTFGLQRIALGFMKKKVIADRLNPIVEKIFIDYANYDGGLVAVGVILYTLQLYMDFSGTMDVVIGIAEIFGVKMPENFRQPFFSKSISEFWTRWHITLGAWFRDYIYYPVSLADKCKKITSAARKKLGNYYGPMISSTIALFCVWFCNGIWHGTGWNFLFFGIYHFVLILTGRLIEPLAEKINKRLHINKEIFLYKSMQIIRTIILVFIGELFFRANTLIDGFKMFGMMIKNFSLNLINDGTIFELGIDRQDFIIVGVMTLVILVISIFKEKGINIRESIANKNIIIRWCFYYAIILSVLIFGAYGVGYIPVNPMYAQY